MAAGGHSATVRNPPAALRRKKFLCEENPAYFAQEMGLIRLLDDIEDEHFGEDMLACIEGYRILRHRIGYFRFWPLEILQKLRHSNLNFCDRKPIILFAIVNELDLTSLFRTLEKLGPAKRNPAAKRIMRSLYYYFLANPGSPQDDGAFRVRTTEHETVESALRRRQRMESAATRRAVGLPYPDHLGIIPEVHVEASPKPAAPTNGLKIVDILIPHNALRVRALPVQYTCGTAEEEALKFAIREYFKGVLRSITDEHINTFARRYRESIKVIREVTVEMEKKKN